MNFRMLLILALSILAINSGAVAQTNACVSVNHGVIVCKDGTTITDAGNGVYVSSTGATITQAGTGVYVGSDGTTITQAGNGVYVSSNGAVFVPSESNAGSSTQVSASSQVGCTYRLMSDSYLAKTYDALADSSSSACYKARTACEAGIEKNKDHLRDFNLACYRQGDKNNPANKYTHTWVMCGDSTRNYRECSISGNNLNVQIGKAYSMTFGSFKDFSGFNEYILANGGEAQWDVVADKSQMVKQCGIQGYKWGVTKDSKRIWVKDGCRGAFRVLYNNIEIQKSEQVGKCSNQKNLDICLKNAGGNACYTKWCF